jgi:hypothetical protein
VRGFAAADGQAALLRAKSHADGAVTLSLEPPGRGDLPAHGSDGARFARGRNRSRTHEASDQRRRAR